MTWEQLRDMIGVMTEKRLRGEAVGADELNLYRTWVEGTAGVPKSGQYWRHYKGGEYVVLSIGLDADTYAPTVVYAATKHGAIDYRGPVWTRPMTVWMETVRDPATDGPEALGTPLRRFVRRPDPKTG